MKRPKPTGKDRKARNGDTLADLERQLEHGQKQLDAAREKLRSAEEAVKPYREQFESYQAGVMNLRCRIDTWHKQFPK